MAGSTRWYTVSRPPEPLPNTGNQLSATANTLISATPMTNTGVDRAIDARVEMTPPVAPPLSAAKVPSAHRRSR